MKFSVAIPTYDRPDGKTAEYLERALYSVLKQSHEDYKVFLIGDKYENKTYFEEISKSIIPADKIYSENLSVAVERERYPRGGLPLWRCGGVSALNHAIDKALEQGFEYVCHLDHDDYWHSQHLELINHVVEKVRPAFVYTQSTYFGNKLPMIESDFAIPNYPEPSNVVHSAVCINHRIIPFKYRDTFHEIGVPDAADADMWRRIKDFCIQNNFGSFLIPRLTCYHPQENS